MDKRLIGTFGVDSGMVMICDPCYFNDVGRFDPKKLENFAKEHDKKGETMMANNMRRLAKSKGEMQMITSDWKSVCKIFKGEAMQFGDGVIASTLHGDGEYEVFANFDKKGRITKIEVKFT